jgi:hypothetical protein
MHAQRPLSTRSSLPNPPEKSALAAALGAARTDYAAKWQVADHELYDLCRRRPSHQDFSDVYAKVTIIGRVYAAGILRSSAAPGDREAAVAEGIRAQADQIDEGLATLSGKRLGLTTIAGIIGLHGRITRDLCPHTGDKLLQSFVSKYLHFHCSLVPIYDSRAAESIGSFVARQRVYNIRKQIGQPTGRLIAYCNFATAFLALTEQLEEATGTRPTVKEVDHLLWRA